MKKDKKNKFDDEEEISSKEKENNCNCYCDEDCDCGCQEGKECHCHEQDDDDDDLDEEDEHCEHEHKHKHHHDHECHCHKHDHDDDDEEDDDECECDEHCHCHEEHDGEHKHHHEHEHDKHHLPPHELEEKARQYLEMAQRLQADFDNYRKHVAEQLDVQKQEGIKSVIEVFLPCLDTFKEAKKSITDEKVLAGVEMIEDKINNALKTLNVEKIETVGQKFDHNTMEVIAVMKNENAEDDIILEEFQAGYKFNGKVIRYAKVIANKL